MPRVSVIFDNLVVMQFCAHDVAVACCLAMAEVWVRLPLGALRDGAVGSSPGSYPGGRWFESVSRHFYIPVGPVLVREGDC